jgi:hypothetical protein
MLLNWPSVKHHNTAVNVDVELLLDVFDIQKVKSDFQSHVIRYRKLFCRFNALPAMYKSHSQC